jgi:hypothetical protein
LRQHTEGDLMKYTFHIVDVFSSTPFGGNQLAVLVSGDRLVAFVTGKGGRRWFSGFNAFKKWGDIEAAFRS